MWLLDLSSYKLSVKCVELANPFLFLLKDFLQKSSSSEEL